MLEVPAIRWATASDGASIAFQTFGDGEVDLVIIPPFAQNIELSWERPEMRRVFTQLGSFARVVHFDKRGTGCSDRTLAVPGLDQRVDDARAVMDAAGVGRCVLYGLSEGGPMAIVFATTYPSRVAGLILHATDARIVDLDASTPEQREEWGWGEGGMFTDWGTPRSRVLPFLAPTAWADAPYRAWEPRYERHCATPAALRELVALSEEIDVRELLASVATPTLVLHARQDPIISIERVRETAATIPGARLVEHDGFDHFPHVGDTRWWMDEVERFVTGREPRAAAAAPALRPPTHVRTFGGFDIERDGEVVPLAEWGSRRARKLCKRLATASGRPVPRDELIELLWPDADVDRQRLSARLSVLLSTVRRLLNGGVIADRDSIRLDLREVHLDLADFEQAVATGRLDEVIALHMDVFLPEEAYADWAIERREWARSMAIDALRRRASRPGHEIADLRRVLDLDCYDVDAHVALIAALDAAGRSGDAQRSRERYAARMAELGVDLKMV